MVELWLKQPLSMRKLKHSCSLRTSQQQVGRLTIFQLLMRLKSSVNHKKGSGFKNALAKDAPQCEVMSVPIVEFTKVALAFSAWSYILKRKCQ